MEPGFESLLPSHNEENVLARSAEAGRASQLAIGERHRNDKWDWGRLPCLVSGRGLIGLVGEIQTLGSRVKDAEFGKKLLDLQREALVDSENRSLRGRRLGAALCDVA